MTTRGERSWGFAYEIYKRLCGELFYESPPTIGDSKRMITHPELVAKLAKPGKQIVQDLSADDAHLLHMAVGICGEAGELLDAIKKKVIYRKELDVENVIEELGDLEFYMEGMRQKLGISRELCVQRNTEKLTKRYGEVYSNEAAVKRADKK